MPGSGAEYCRPDLQYEGKAIDLTKNEYRILLCLMERKGQVVSRELLMQRLWETDSFVDENTLTVNVNRLRKSWRLLGFPSLSAPALAWGTWWNER